MKKLDLISLVDSMAEAVLILDPKGNVVAASGAYAELFGFKLDDIVGKHFTELPGIEKQNPLDIPKYANLLKDAFFKGKVGPVNLDIISLGGNKLPVSVSGGIIKDEKGKTTHLIAVIRDVSDIKQAEAKIKAADLEWQNTFDAIEDLIMVLDLDYRIKKANRAALKFFKLPLEKVIGNFCYKLMHGTNEPIPECPLSRLKVTRHHEETELFLKEKGIWVWISADPVFNEHGDLREIVHVIRDITKLKQAEEAISISEGKFRMAFENAKDAIFWADPRTGLIEQCNHAAEVLLGKKKDEIIGKPQTMLHPPQKAQLYMEMFKKHIEQQGALDEEAEVITASGVIKPVYISASLAMIGKKQMIQGIFRDISQFKQAKK